MYSTRLIAGDIYIRDARFTLTNPAWDYAFDRKIRKVADKKFEGSIGKVNLLNTINDWAIYTFKGDRFLLCVSALEFVFGKVPKIIYYA